MIIQCDDKRFYKNPILKSKKGDIYCYYPDDDNLRVVSRMSNLKSWGNFVSSELINSGPDLFALSKKETRPGYVFDCEPIWLFPTKLIIEHSGVIDIPVPNSYCFEWIYSNEELQALMKRINWNKMDSQIKERMDRKVNGKVNRNINGKINGKINNGLSCKLKKGKFTMKWVLNKIS